MGDRANIIVKNSNEQVCLYTHWYGDELPGILQAAMKRGKDRLDDYQYLTRIIFCEMVKGKEMALTGFGITNQIFDGGSKVIEVDTEKDTVKLRDGDPIPFDDFLGLEKAGWPSITDKS